MADAVGVEAVDRTPASAWERAVDELLVAAHLAAPHALPGLLARHAATFGARDAVLYLVDLQQTGLVPFLGSADRRGRDMVRLGIDGTVAGRAFQRIEVQTQHVDTRGTRVWLPLMFGVERLGVLSVLVLDTEPEEEREDSPEAGREAGREVPDALVLSRLTRFASLAAELVATKTLYGDTIVVARRTAAMDLAAEMQWGLLPPLAFACDEVVVAGALEPAYEVAGDSVDYSVDEGRVRFAVFDGMGHGLQSAQLAVLAVSAYRHARRSGRSLSVTAQLLDEAVHEVYRGEAFVTAVIAELDTDTGLLSWVSAGHPGPLLLRHNKLVKQLEVEPGLPLGIGLSDLAQGAGGYAVATENLQPGDRLVAFTDGVTEAPSPGGDRFGEDRLVDLLVRNLAGGLPAPETMRRLVRELLGHQQGQLSDDATLLMVEWRSDQPSPVP